ncbi:MAG: Rrf2 family transcriptional regulator [Candidatus Omnitrophica bacterium]|nr:Rrf2 family transcriptional regulator [Candidatus Omnitrophota bacterium]
MKLITKNTDYAVRALLVLGGHPQEYISARQVALEQLIPYQYVRKLLRKLMHYDLVVSRDGAGGGFTLKSSPSKIKLADIIRIFQGDIQLSECMFRKKICPQRSRCVLRTHIMSIERLVEKEFNGITLESMLKELKGKK